MSFVFTIFLRIKFVALLVSCFNFKHNLNIGQQLQ